jgi:hypothetical protein
VHARTRACVHALVHPRTRSLRKGIKPQPLFLFLGRAELAGVSPWRAEVPPSVVSFHPVVRALGRSRARTPVLVHARSVSR